MVLMERENDDESGGDTIQGLSTCCRILRGRAKTEPCMFSKHHYYQIVLITSTYNGLHAVAPPSAFIRLLVSF
jgi:hypothetical protein